jgi:hypothetical protein
VKILIFIWLVAQKSILTKDNMLKRRWQGNLWYYFCGSIEIVDDLLFTCHITNVIWGIVAICFHQHDRPSSYEQFRLWIKKALSGRDLVFMLGLAPICWAIQNARNKACILSMP